MFRSSKQFLHDFSELAAYFDPSGKISHRARPMTMNDEVSCFPVLSDLMMALQSTETHIYSENLALFRSKLRDSLSTNQIARIVNYYCYGVNAIEFLMIRLKN